MRPYAIGAINLKYRGVLLSPIAIRDYYKSKLSMASSACRENCLCERSSENKSRALTHALLTQQS